MKISRVRSYRGFLILLIPLLLLIILLFYVLSHTQNSNNNVITNNSLNHLLHENSQIIQNSKLNSNYTSIYNNNNNNELSKEIKDNPTVKENEKNIKNYANYENYKNKQKKLEKMVDTNSDKNDKQITENKVKNNPKSKSNSKSLSNLNNPSGQQKIGFVTISSGKMNNLWPTTDIFKHYCDYNNYLYINGDDIPDEDIEQFILNNLKSNQFKISDFLSHIQQIYTKSSSEVVMLSKQNPQYIQLKKFSLLLYLFSIYPFLEWIFWSDLDSLILKQNVKLEEFVDKDFDIILSAGPAFNSVWSGIISTGHFFIRNSEAGKQFLIDAAAIAILSVRGVACTDMAIQPIDPTEELAFNGWLHLCPPPSKITFWANDQGIVQYLVSYSPMYYRCHVKFVGFRDFNTEFPFSDLQQDFLIHFPFKPIEYRTEFIEKIINCMKLYHFIENYEIKEIQINSQNENRIERRRRRLLTQNEGEDDESVNDSKPQYSLSDDEIDYSSSDCVDVISKQVSNEDHQIGLTAAKDAYGIFNSKCTQN